MIGVYVRVLRSIRIPICNTKFLLMSKVWRSKDICSTFGKSLLVSSNGYPLSSNTAVGYVEYGMVVEYLLDNPYSKCSLNYRVVFIYTTPIVEAFWPWQNTNRKYQSKVLFLQLHPTAFRAWIQGEILRPETNDDDSLTRQQKLFTTI